jgi:hypothetical protein
MPGGQNWLNYLAQMYGLGGGQDPNAPSPDAQPMSMTDLSGAATGNGGFAVPPADPNVNPHGDGPPGPVSPTVAPPRPPPSPLGASVGINRPPPVGAGLLDQSGVVRMGGPQGVLNTQRPTGASAPVGAGLLDQSGVARNPAGVLTPGVSPNAPSPAAAPVASPAAPGGATAAPRAAPQGGGPAANPRFTTFQYNVPGSGGGQGGRNAPIYTALNLGGLFGGQPQGAPAQTPRPAVPGPMANQGGFAVGTPDFSNLPDDTFDTGAGPMMRKRGSSPSARAAAASLKQRYG